MTAQTRYVPPEWAPQTALWVGWPHLPGEWGDAFTCARQEIADFIAQAARFQPVRVACGSKEAWQSAEAMLADVSAQVDLVSVPTGDIWLRDTGPIIADQDQAATALTFEFNGWGGKYVMPGDTETAAAIADAERIPAAAHNFVLEGGAIEFDGAGRLLTTRQCLLNPNRNTAWREAEAHAALKTAFGVEQILWLDRGLIGDHTDGHIDNLARFVGPGHVLCQTPSGADDPQADILSAAGAALRDAGLRVSTLPSPGMIRDDAGEAMPASHMNYVVINGAVLLPDYEPVYSAKAAEVLAELFPDREIVSCAARAILQGGGSLHCMTREIPHIGPVAAK